MEAGLGSPLPPGPRRYVGSSRVVANRYRRSGDVYEENFSTIEIKVPTSRSTAGWPQFLRRAARISGSGTRPAARPGPSRDGRPVPQTANESIARATAALAN